MTLHLAFVSTENLKAFDGVPIEGGDEVGHDKVRCGELNGWYRQR